ncbi:RWD domain-containing protein 2B-like [Glandiceps talaboti]
MVDKGLLELQLSEVEMLSSMFPGQHEFQMDDPGSVHEIREYIDGSSTCLPRRVSFTLCIQIELHHLTTDINVLCSLPHDYPNSLPEVFIRCQKCSREEQKQINSDVIKYLTSLERGELCINATIEWIQDNFKNYISHHPALLDERKTYTSRDDMSSIFSRLWIHSHHIYNIVKRKNIVEWANELGLSGFSLPGKPGIICVEGDSKMVSEFWSRIKRLNWKKITMKQRDDVAIETHSHIDKHRHFEKFEEKNFDVQSFGHGRDYHMNWGLVYTFLASHQCGEMFKTLLGIEGKTCKDQ